MNKPFKVGGIALFIFSLIFPSILIAQNTIVKVFNNVEASQAVMVGDKYFYGISNTIITRYDKITGEKKEEWSPTGNLGYIAHLGSGTLFDGNLFIAEGGAANTIEIFDVSTDTIKHVKSVTKPDNYGDLNWVDRRQDGSWWICYAHYNADNGLTKLVEYNKDDNHNFTEVDSWTFPQETVNTWGGAYSTSGGSWGPDDKLYIAGHDGPEVSVVEINDSNELVHLRIENQLGINGQGVMWDRTVSEPHLWGIDRTKREISYTLIPAAAGGTVNLPPTIKKVTATPAKIDGISQGTYLLDGRKCQRAFQIDPLSGVKTDPPSFEISLFSPPSFPDSDILPRRRKLCPLMLITML